MERLSAGCVWGLGYGVATMKPVCDELDQHFMQLALKEAQRAECLRRQVGAVLVRDGKVIATGYNGAPRGLAKAGEFGCLRARMGVRSGELLEICRGIHAEQRAIVQAAVQGISTRGSILY